MTRLATGTGTGRVDLCTPADLVARARYVLDDIELDPASNPRSVVDAAVAFVDPAMAPVYGALPEGFLYEDGLSFNWNEAKSVFVNPPYGRGHNRAWAKKADKHGVRGLPLIALVPAATSAVWWGHYWNADCLALLIGRLTHLDEPNPAPFAQCVAGWCVDPIKFHEVFSEIGRVRPCVL